MVGSPLTRLLPGPAWSSSLPGCSHFKCICFLAFVLIGLRPGLKECSSLRSESTPSANYMMLCHSLHPHLTSPILAPPRSLNIYSQRFVGVNFDVDFAGRAAGPRGYSPSLPCHPAPSAIPLLSYVRDNHLRLHLSFALLSALVLSCEKCILPQFVALAVRCRLPARGCEGEVESRGRLCMCVVMQAASCKPLSPCFDATA